MKALEWAGNFFKIWRGSPSREHTLLRTHICAAETVRYRRSSRSTTPPDQPACTEPVARAGRQNNITTDEASTITATEEQQTRDNQKSQQSHSPNAESDSKAESQETVNSADENIPYIECFVFKVEGIDDYTQSFPPTMIAVSDGIKDCPAILLTADLSAKIQTVVRAERKRNMAQAQRNDRRNYLKGIVQSIEAKKESLAERYQQLCQDIEQLPLQKCFTELRAIDIRQAELSGAVQEIMAQNKTEDDHMQKLNMEHIRRNFEVNQIMSDIFTDAKLVDAEMAFEEFDKTLPFDTRILEDDFQQTTDGEDLLPLGTTDPDSNLEPGAENVHVEADEVADVHTAIHELDDDFCQEPENRELNPVQAAWKEVQTYQSNLYSVKATLYHHTDERWEAEAKWEDLCEAGLETRSGFEGWFETRLDELEHRLESAQRDLRVSIDIGRAFGLALDDNGLVPRRHEADDESDDTAVTPVSTKAFVAAWVDTAESGLEESAPDEATVEWSARSVDMCDSQSVLNEVFEEQRQRIDKWQATCGQLRLERDTDPELC